MGAKVRLQSNYVNRSGKSRFYLVIYNNTNKKRKLYGLSMFLEPKFWDEQKCTVRGSHPYHFQYRTDLNKLIDRADMVIMQLSNMEQFTFSNFEMEFFKKKTVSLADLYNEYVEKHSNLKITTAKQFKGELSKLEKFRSGSCVSEIDHNFILDYERHMKNVCGNCLNTVAKSMRKLKTVLNYAIVRQYIDKNPMSAYKIRRETTTREYLVSAEMQKLEMLYKNGMLPEKLRSLLRYFLFSCYTGLRYSDISALTWNEIKLPANDEPGWIKIKQEKTSEPLKIPMNNKALEFLPEEKPSRVFRVVSNQKCNDYLKLIMLAAGIEKNVTYHTSRHTFATLALNLGIPLEVVQKLLGHREIKTTQVYAKLLDKTLQREIEKFNT